MHSAIPLLVALPLAAAAEPIQHGQVILEPPPGWDVLSHEGGTLTLSWEGGDGRCAFCYLRVGPGGEATGSLTAWLGSESLRYVEEEDRATAEVTAPPEAVTAGGRPAAMTGLTADGDVHVLVAIEAGGRYELVAFQGWAYDGEELGKSLATLEADLLPLIDRLRFVSEGAAPLMPAAVPGDLDGLWWGWFQGMSMGLDGMAHPTVDQRRIAFWPDGRFYDGTPPGGLAPLDPAALATDPNWGTYKETGKTLTLTYASGRTETLTAEAGGWSDGSRVLSLAEPLPDGARLEGRVESFLYTGFAPGSGIEGGIASESSTTFRRDGTYEGESFGGAFGNFTDAGGSVTGGFATDGGTTATGGTYEVRDGLLVMRPADGSPPTAEIAHRAGEDVALGDLFLEGRVLPPK